MSSSDAPCQDCVPSTTADTATCVPRAGPLEVMDPSTFSPPVLSESSTADECPRVVIEFCDRCRWLHRAVWTQTELFLTFPPALPVSASDSPPSNPGLKAITLLPRNSPETGGRFRVWLLMAQPQDPETEGQGEPAQGGPQPTGTKSANATWRGYSLVWDRKVEGGFPEMKVLKQRIRNLIAPQQDLGHSDKPAKASQQVS